MKGERRLSPAQRKIAAMPTAEAEQRHLQALADREALRSEQKSQALSSGPPRKPKPNDFPARPRNDGHA